MKYSYSKALRLLLRRNAALRLFEHTVRLNT